MAQASAANCVLLEQEAAARGLDQPDAITASPDNYVRIAGWRTTYSFPEINVAEVAVEKDVYQFTVPGTETQVSVDKDGNWIDLSGTGIRQIGDPKPQYFLVLYKPVGWEGKVTEHCDLEQQVNWWPVGAPDPSPPEYCIAPMAEISQNQPDNIALQVSCLCSMIPDNCG